MVFFLARCFSMDNETKKDGAQVQKRKDLQMIWKSWRIKYSIQLCEIEKRIGAVYFAESAMTYRIQQIILIR
jgi:hypothetical protein